MDSVKKVRYRRRVPITKYEAVGAFKSNWSEQVIKGVRDKYKPPDRRPSVVMRLMPSYVYNTLAPIVQLEPNLEDENFLAYWETYQSVEDWKHEEELKKEVLSLYSEPPQTSTTSVSSSIDDLVVLPPSQDRKSVDGFGPKEYFTSRYLKFINLPEAKAAIWRPKEEIHCDGYIDIEILLNPDLKLNFKMEFLVDKISKSFCEWLRGLGGLENSLNEDAVIHLFEIVFDYPASTSLCTRVRELPVVTNAIATAAGIPQAEVRAGLRTELIQDAFAELREPCVTAFGTTLDLSSPHRFQPPDNEVMYNWLESNRVPGDLATMKVVFEGTNKLKSVKAFCKWLNKHPEIPPPPYLLEQGLLGRGIRKSRHMYSKYEHQPVTSQMPKRIRDSTREERISIGERLLKLQRQSMGA